MASIEKAYDPVPLDDYTRFVFKSVGIKGEVNKLVFFQHIRGNLYNLAFGDFRNGKMDDRVVTNNQDLSAVIATVAKCVYIFLEEHPGSRLKIKPVDKKRASLYNYVIRNRQEEISELFDIFGVEDDAKTKFDPKTFYSEFELIHKVS